MIRARLFRRLQLFRATGAGNDRGAHQLANLHRRQADAARRAENEQRFTGLQARPVIKGDVASAIGDLEGGGVDEIHRLGDGHGTIRRKTAVFGQPALSAEDGHTCSGGGAVGIRPQCRNGACDFHSKGERGLGGILIFAFDHQEIGEVQAAGADLYGDFTHAGLRGRDLGENGGRPG